MAYDLQQGYEDFGVPMSQGAVTDLVYNQATGRHEGEIRRAERILLAINSLVCRNVRGEIDEEETLKAKLEDARTLPVPPRGYCYVMRKTSGNIEIAQTSTSTSEGIRVLKGINHRTLVEQDSLGLSGIDMLRARISGEAKSAKGEKAKGYSKS